MRNVAFRHPWVLLLDADERVTPGLHAAALAAVESLGEEVAFRVQRRDFLNGTWLRHVQASAFYLRLFRPEKLRYERVINTRSVADGSVADIRGYLDHYPFSKGIGHWLERHNAYSSLEARQILVDRARHAGYSLREAFLSGDFHERRYHQKELFYRLPFRPLVKFCLLYLIKRGFLDGRAGFQYAMLQAVYEYMIVLKVREMAGEIHHAG